MYAVAVVGGDVYVGGRFTKMDNVAANNIARWNGTAWGALGQGIGKVPGVSGGAILGDGCVGLILDTAEIVALARENTSVVDRRHESVSQAA